MKEKFEFQNVVVETLLIPLYMRATESKRKSQDIIISDPLAESLVNNIDYDYSKFDNAWMSALGCVIRGRLFDQKVQEFILKEEHPIAVNIGCGLDTRYQRIKERKNCIFYEIDLPEVIAIRKHFIPEPKNDFYIEGSILENNWMDKLKEKHPDSHFIFTMEGVMMYFYEKQVIDILKNLANRFPGGEIYFDVCGPMMVKTKLKPDSLRKNEAQIRSGISNGKIVEKWVPQLEITGQWLYQNYAKKRWGVFGYIFRIFPKFTCKFSSILGYKIKK